MDKKYFYKDYDMLIEDAAPLNTVSVVATQNGVEGVSGNPGTPVQFTFTRTGSTTSSLNVSYTLFGTAVAGVDYTGSQTGTVTFGAGVSSVVLSLPTIEDLFIDPVNIVRLRIDPTANYDIATGKQFAEATIVGDDIISSEIKRVGSNVPGWTTFDYNSAAYAALKKDGSVVTWGLAIYGGDSSSAGSSTRLSSRCGLRTMRNSAKARTHVDPTASQQ